MTIPVIPGSEVLRTVSPADAIDRTRQAFERHARGEWVMPAKVYLDSPPHGDFRAMPARGDGLALIKWVTSFPGNVARGLPAVTGVVVLSDAVTGTELAVMDCRSITSLRTGAAAAVSALTLAAEGSASVGILGCGVNGSWAARCLAAAGFGPGVCFDPNPVAAEAIAGELGWGTGAREEALGADIVATITPGHEPVIRTGELRPGQHVAALGADSHAKAELELGAIAECRLFCDEWEQASAGGELAHAVTAGAVVREDVTQLGAVLSGRAVGRRDPSEITLFDSTGLAIQDLAVAQVVYEAWKRGEVEAPLVDL